MKPLNRLCCLFFMLLLCLQSVSPALAMSATLAAFPKQPYRSCVDTHGCPVNRSDPSGLDAIIDPHLSDAVYARMVQMIMDSTLHGTEEWDLLNNAPGGVNYVLTTTSGSTHTGIGPENFHSVAPNQYPTLDPGTYPLEFNFNEMPAPGAVDKFGQPDWARLDHEGGHAIIAAYRPDRYLSTYDDVTQWAVPYQQQDAEHHPIDQQTWGPMTTREMDASLLFQIPGQLRAGNRSVVVPAGIWPPPSQQQSPPPGP